MTSNKIALIILTYNRFNEFRLALESALVQKGADYHVFIFDNCSDQPLDSIIPQNKKITYIRHKKNIGFAGNFKFATNYVKEKGFELSFLLGDDDVLAYPYVLRDLFMLIKKDPEIHVARGGYVEFINNPPVFTRILTFSQKDFNNFLDFSEIDKAIAMHITSYSGILFKNDYFDPYFSPNDDLITPFMAPILKILTKKKFAFFPDKITLFIKTDHLQLATLVYNEKTSNQDALEEIFKLLNRKYKRRVSLVELMNYKIYSKRKKYIKKYYKECLLSSRKLKSIKYVAAYYTPSYFLNSMRIIYKNIKCFSIKKQLEKEHKYLNRNLLG